MAVANRTEVWTNTFLTRASPLRLAYRVAQVCNADARDHRRVAKNDWRAGEAVEESNSRAKKNRRDVDVDFVEEPRIQALLDGVGAVDPDGLRGSGGFGLVHGAFDAVGDEAVERHGHDCYNLRHCVLLSRDGDCVQRIARSSLALPLQLSRRSP